MSALDLLLIASVLVGMTVQGALGFGFAFFVAPVAFATFEPERALVLVVLLGVAINLLILFGERRRPEVALGTVGLLVAAAVPGMAAGAAVLSEVDQQALRVLVAVVVLVGAAVQWRIATRSAPALDERSGAPVAELAGGLGAGLLTTSVSVNGPPVVLTLSHLGLRGATLRDSLAATLLVLNAAGAIAITVVAGTDTALPSDWVALACVPAMLLGHRAGARVFARLDEGSHHAAALAAAASAGMLGIVAALA